MNSGKVKVEIRIKPCRDDISEVNQNKLSLGSKIYEFDRIWDQYSLQRDIFEGTVVPMLDRFIEGYNCTILAYGQTGSGKTYTMGISLENLISYLRNENRENQGMVIQSLEYLYGNIEKDKEFELYCSFIEIYNEEVIDILSGLRTPLSLREVNGEIVIYGVKEFTVEDIKECIALLKKGCLERTTKSTKMNISSSRSHAIFTLNLKRVVGGRTVLSKFNFVDLAGSERIKRTEVVGERVKESISINSGLLSLGNVISSLYKMNNKMGKDKQSFHIPYRDSKLTRILQSSLGGNSNTLMIACISVSGKDVPETHNTLKYANRAMNICNEMKRGVEVDSNNLKNLELKKEIQRLRQENLCLRERIKKQELTENEVRKYEDRISSLTEVVVNKRECKIEKIDNFNKRVYEEKIRKLYVELGKVREEKKAVEEELKRTREVQRKVISGKGRENATLRDGMGGERDTDVKHKRVVRFLLDDEIKGESFKRRRCIEGDISSPCMNKFTQFDTSIIEDNTSFNIPPTTIHTPLPASKGCAFLDSPIFPSLDSKTTLKVRGTFPGHKNVVNSVGVLDSKVYSSSNDCTVRYYDISRENNSNLLINEDSIIKNVQCNEVDGCVYYTLKDVVKRVDVRGNFKENRSIKLNGILSVIRIRGDLLYCGYENGSVSIYDTRNEKDILSKTLHRGTVFTLELIGDTLYSGSRDHTIGYISPQESGLLKPPHYDSVHQLIEHRGDLISVGRDCSMKRWSGDTKKVVKTLPYAHDSWIKAGCNFEEHFCTGARDGSVRIWSYSGESVRCIDKGKIPAGVNCMVRVGKGVVIGSQDRNVYYIEGEW
ncbi:kinesin-like protein KIF21B [Nylanderia fulva]|uniref:kinesin-like protein KIF21B n=1 Tax=Nylanderia fulva TaxID=613905 RepID=UPI0010FBB2CA|nr:kinesin-like protein KIF21B [Nylanderia fulva]